MQNYSCREEEIITVKAGRLIILDHKKLKIVKDEKLMKRWKVKEENKAVLIVVDKTLNIVKDEIFKKRMKQ